MPSVAINFGRILVFIGGIGYLYGYMNQKVSITALIPAFFGLVLLVLGYVARAKDSLRKHIMHVAVIVALLGFIASAGRLLSKFSELSLSPAVISQIAMAVTCLLFVVLCIRSFVNARKE